MRNIIKFFASQGTFINLITFGVIVVGIYSIIKIKREAFPNVTYDMVFVTTIFPGASPDETEKLITNPLEQDFKELDGIKRMMSVSTENRSLIILQLNPDEITQEEAENDIQDVVDNFKDLPEDAEDPTVTSIETKLMPIIEVSLSGELSEEKLRAISKDLEKRIENISEVARVEFNGLRDIEIKVEAGLDKLRRYQISFNDLISALSQQNLSIPGGTFKQSDNGKTKEYIIRTIGDFKSLEDIKNTVVRANDLAEAILVKDVAKVYQDFTKEEVIYKTNGKRSINLTVLKKESADAINLVDRIKEVVESSRTNILKEVNVEYINDFSYFIRRRLSVLSNNMIVGLSLVLLLLSITLPWRVALVASVGIPFSFLGTILIFYYSGISINLITMMGLIIVVGMLVDDAIVVTENSQRYMEKGLSPMDAAIRGTQEIWAPVTASVMTTIMVFGALFFMTGIFGKFISNIPLGVVIALLISLFECFFVLPHHLGRWVRVNDNNQNTKKQRHISNFWNNYIIPYYLKILKSVVKHRYISLGVVLSVLVGTIVFVKFKMKFILFPPGGIEAFQINAEAPTGTPLYVTDKLIDPIEKEIKQIPKEYLDSFTTKIGIQKVKSNDIVERRGGEFVEINVYLTPAQGRKKKANEIIEELRNKVGLPDGLVKINYQKIKGGPPVGAAVNIGVRGADYENILKGVKEIKDTLKNLEGVSDIEDSYVLGKKEIVLKINKKEAAAAGLSVEQIGTSVRAAYEGIVATSIKELEEEIDIRVSLGSAEKRKRSSLLHLEVPNRQGNLVKLSSVAHITQHQGISFYEHEKNSRQITVSAEVDPKVSSSSMVNDIVREKIPKLEEKYLGLNFHFGGEDQDTKESMAALIKAGLISLIGIMIMLILTFGSLMQSLLVLSSVPLGFISVIWVFYLHDKPLSFLGMIGLIALAGVIVNNAIVFVDFINQRRKEGLDRFESIFQAAATRIRPIILTTITTVCGILPTAYGIGGMDPFVVPIALSLGWGMFFGSILTTFILPASLSILDDIRLLFKV